MSNNINLISKNLTELKTAMMDLHMLLTIYKKHIDMGIKIYNPHCSKWKTCNKNIFNDCFMCDFNCKGSEQYFNEKLINNVKMEYELYEM